jgi:hypothetical protein
VNFALERQHAKLTSLNARAEKHGDENVPAADLAFTFNAPNDILSEFDPALKSSLYRKPDAAGDQADLLPEPGWLPKLRFPAMSAFKWDFEMIGGQITIHYGPSGKGDIALDITKADGLKFQPKDGGTVEVSFRVAIRPSEKEIGKLFAMIQEDVELSLSPPAADAQLEAA